MKALMVVALAALLGTAAQAASVPSTRLVEAGRGVLVGGAAWEPTQVPADVRVPAGAVSLDARVLPSSTRLSVTTTQVDVRVDGRLVRRVSIRWRLPSVVRRGQQVLVRARFGGVEGELLCEALSDGAPGDVIRVRNVGSRKTRSGRVTASGEVEVGR